MFARSDNGSKIRPRVYLFFSVQRTDSRRASGHEPVGFDRGETRRAFLPVAARWLRCTATAVMQPCLINIRANVRYQSFPGLDLDQYWLAY